MVYNQGGNTQTDLTANRKKMKFKRKDLIEKQLLQWTTHEEDNNI